MEYRLIFVFPKALNFAPSVERSNIVKTRLGQRLNFFRKFLRKRAHYYFDPVTEILESVDIYTRIKWREKIPLNMIIFAPNDFIKNTACWNKQEWCMTYRSGQFQ